MHSFAFQLPGYFNTCGPIAAGSLESAKAEIRRRLGVQRLPKGIQIWNLAERPLPRWKVVEPQ